MECKVFSTSRLIRDYIAESADGLLPKLYTMEEFLRRVVVVEGRAFVDEGSRVLYLYRAIEGIEIGRLGFEREFVTFLKNSSFIFRFFEEIFAERVEIETLRSVDTYADFEDHLEILEKIYERYVEVLEREGLVDRITIKKYRLNENFLKQFSQIDIYVDGYLSRFEMEVLSAIRNPLFLHFDVTPFNRKLVERLEIDEKLKEGMRYTIGLKEKSVLKKEAIEPFKASDVEVAAFAERIDQVAFVLKKVDEFVQNGADPAKTAVVLPDESFAEYLRLFDSVKNFNYAMGTPFMQTGYYRSLADLYDALTSRSESAKEKTRRGDLWERFEKVEDFPSFLKFLDSLKASPRELEAIDEERHIFSNFSSLLQKESPLNLLKSWLQRVEPLSLDDVGGGKVTVMGVLESRGKSFDGVVVVDFNEDVVPKVGEKDIFLNSSIRAHAGMPTRKDKENLQKNYYYTLLQKSRFAAICCVKNEESSPSRFLKELGLAEGELMDGAYRPIIASPVKEYRLFNEVLQTENPFEKSRRLTPTKLKDYLLCKRRFYYKYVAKIRKEEREESEDLGSLIHASLETAAKVKGSFASKSDYFGFVMDNLFKRAEGAMKRLEISIEWEERLKRFCELDFDALSRTSQPLVEGWCNVEFEGFALSAKIDRVDVGERGVRVIDYKTSKNVKKLIEDEKDFQLLFYRLWAESQYREKEIETIYWDLYETKEVSVDPLPMKSKLKEVLDHLLEPKSLSYEKCEDESACRYCDYRVACGRDS